MGPRVVPTVEEIERAARGLDPVFAGSPLLQGRRWTGRAALGSR